MKNMYINTNQRFAGDIVLFCENSKEMDTMINELNVENILKNVDLRVTIRKTKVLFNSFAESTRCEPIKLAI